MKSLRSKCDSSELPFYEFHLLEMPRINADGWYKRLIEALRKRAAKDQAEGKDSWFMWHAAVKNITITQNGTSVRNLPTESTRFGKTVRETS